ncbi:MAG: hypothetical protein IJ125_08325 [Atopobiaceae bacterium]|nr:hypothetical protein [Atopobiaceae bacterium]
MKSILHNSEKLLDPTALPTSFDYDKNLSFYRTARFDMSSSRTATRLEVIDASPYTDYSKPAWLNKDGFGYVLTATRSPATMALRCTASGQAQIVLRGMQLKTEQGRRIPCWIAYNLVIINGEEQLPHPVSLHHDRPHIINLEMVEGVEYAISIDWTTANLSSDELYLKDYEHRSKYVDSGEPVSKAPKPRAKLLAKLRRRLKL